jgi:hypothetical protein
MPDPLAEHILVLPVERLGSHEFLAFGRHRGFDVRDRAVAPAGVFVDEGDLSVPASLESLADQELRHPLILS